MLNFNKREKTNESSSENRGQFRFPIMRNSDLKAYVRILPYYRSEELEGRPKDFSAQGMALCIPKMIPAKNFIYIQVTLPNGVNIACHGEIKHVEKISEFEYQIGLEFLDLPSEPKEAILTMSKEYNACGENIKQFKKTNCSPQCSVYGICNRHEKVYTDN